MELCAGHSSSSAANSSNHVGIDLAFCIVILEQKGAFQKLLPYVVSAQLSKMPLYTVVLTVPFTGKT